MNTSSQLEANAFPIEPATRATPERHVVCTEALSFLAAHPAESGSSVITSLPDVSELPELGFEGWRAWFLRAARSVLAWTPEDGVSIFFQSDIRYRGAWVDKGYLVQRAAEDLGQELVFHKIVCRKTPGTITHGRASYSHLLCFSKRSRGMPRAPGPDVLADAGAMSWSKAMGENACRLACRYLASETATRLVVDPFCGQGTVLAVANEFGFDALGVDLSQRKCRVARRLQVGVPKPAPELDEPRQLEEPPT
ncbi:MAG TPA: hypothetical protein VFQ61_19805 [Polyangiaceae bacterium]|nr:hypothetical protein [Polyangiaceae bacterium]